jgi:membrane protease YdiL (CAAX protease family)
MSSTEGEAPSAPPTGSCDAGSPALLEPTRHADRLASLIEVVVCSGFPTQLVVMLALGALGLQPFVSGSQLSLRYLVWLSLADTVLLLSLVLFFLRVRGDNPRGLLLGARPAGPEAWIGLLWVPAVFLIVVGLSTVITKAAPWLRNVPENPLASLLQRPRDIVVFAIVAVVAGGVREEIQRAFILDRFERHLGGAVVGLVLFSVVFGLGHALQGWDATLLTAVLGAIWGALYLWRRSIVAPLVCHAAFNLAEVAYHAIAG